MTHTNPLPQAKSHVHRHDGISRSERFRLLARSGATVWMTGLSGSGKSTIASALETRLLTLGVPAYRLDGDNLRTGINRDLGFSEADRSENIRRVAEIARLFADSGTIAIVSAISPRHADRDYARDLHRVDFGSLDHETPLTFLEVFVDAPLELCKARDPKGLYRKARTGLVRNFTGIDSPYEPPTAPELVLTTATTNIDSCVESCLSLLDLRTCMPCKPLPHPPPR